MKKWGMLLLVLVLLAGMTIARADSMDFAPYALEQRNYYIFSVYPRIPDEHNFLALCRDQDTKEQALVWWRDRAIDRVVSIEKWNGDYEFLPRSDGSCGVVHISKAGEASQQKVTLYDWEEEGFVNGQEIPITGLISYAVVKDGFALLDDDGSQTFLKIFDGYGNQEARIEVDRAIDAVSRIARSGPGRWIAMVYQRHQYGNQNQYLLIIRDGNVVGKIEPITRTFSGSLDGQGGFFLCTQKGESTYKPVEIAHYDENGNLLWKKTLSGNKVVLSVHAHIAPETGHTVLTGTAMANSRKVYRVFRMEVDDQGRTVSMDVRESNYHNSIYYYVSVFPDTGNTWVLFDGALMFPDVYDYPEAFVPFDALPKADNPGIQLR